MDTKEHTNPKNLLKYAFLWNQARLVVAAASLILGGFPVVYKIFSSSSSMVGSLLKLSWIISGVAAGYLLWLFIQGGKKLWGGKDKIDLTAFAIAIISGLHLGWAGLFGTNVGMSVLPYGLLPIIMLVAGALYLWSAFHLYKRFTTDSEMFGATAKSQVKPAQETQAEAHSETKK